jgi:chorismate dehydratase
VPQTRIGAVNYLNARPLVVDLPRFAPDARIIIDYPSRLATALKLCQLDVGLVPSIEYRRQADLAIVSDACIACEGPVKSVRLYSRVELARVRTLALDEGSRTSAVLAQIFLAERYGVRPALQPFLLDTALEDTSSDAVVVIGDRGMLPPRDASLSNYDLGEEWTGWTGLPFVFAMWVARTSVATAALSDILSAARDSGVTKFEELAEAAAPEVGLPASECLSYLRDNLKFRFGPREHEGLKLYYALAEKYSLV